jgi:hypothetical protein
MFATIRGACAVAFTCLATMTQAESELWFRKAEKVALARGIRRDGFACPEITTVYFVAAKPDGNHMRAVCGSPDGSAVPSSFRLTVRGSGAFRAARWDGDGVAETLTQFAAGYLLRTSLN